MLWDNVLESFMLVCFAAAWPASIHKSWTSKTRKGKSLFFLVLIFIGYLAGIVRVLISEDKGFMLFPYSINELLVFCDLLLYYRNYRIDENKPPIISKETTDFLRNYFQNHSWRKHI